MIKRFLCCLLIITADAWAGSPVWQISKGGNHLYLAGTVHVLAKSDYPLPVEFDEAYKASSLLVFETDMDKVKSIEFQQALLRAMTYTDGRSLKSVLSNQSYADLSALIAERGLSMDLFANFKPSMVMLTITLFELKRLGLGEAGVDDFFYTKAQRDNKLLGQLEKPEEQLAFITSMGEGKEDELIAYALEDIKTLPKLMHEMKQAWAKGKLDELASIGIEPMRKEFPNVYQNMLVKRNAKWMPQVERMLGTPEVEMVLVGALHLAGKDGLLDQLEQRGYIVKALDKNNNE